MKTPLAILLFLLLPVAAHAYQWRLGESTNAWILPAGETLAEETLLTAYQLDVQGQAARDLWLLASTAIRYDGRTEGDLRALGSSAVLGGEVRQNLLAYARGLQLTRTAVVRGQAALFGTTVICEGQIDGDAWIFADSVTLGGRWGGNVRIQAGEIRIAPDTVIAGDLTYSAPKTVVLDPSVAIAGTVTQVPAATAPVSFRANLALHGYLFLAALLVGMPFVGFFPVLAGGAVRNLRATPWRVLLAGLVTLLLGPFLIAFAFMTIVGIPLALLLGALYAALAYLAHVVVALWLGHRFLRVTGPQTFARVLAALALGLFALYFLAAFPGVAAFLVPPVLVLGTGALALALLRRPSLSLLPPMPPPVPDSAERPATPE